MKHKRQSAHDCPVAGCPHSRLHSRAVCDPCWALLPDDIRGRIESARATKSRCRESAAAIEAVDWLNAHGLAPRAPWRLGETGFQEGAL